MHHIVIVNRQAYGTSGGLSRSLSARVLENLEYVRDKKLISITQIEEKDLEYKFKASDVLVFARHTSLDSLNLSARARDSGAKVIYDLDDFMPALPSWVNHSGNKETQNNIFSHVKQATAVTTSTAVLKTNIDRYFGVNSMLIPTGINIERHLKTPKPIDETNAVIYTNTDTIKLRSFKEGFIQVLNQYLDTHPEFTAHLVCDPNPEMKRIHNAKHWGTMSWFEHKKFLGERDYLFSVTPLGGEEDPSDFLFNSCKSPIKYLDYGALRIPGIYSRTPAYDQFVTHMETGILVSNNADEWSWAMELLTKDRELRSKIIENAFADIKARFHTSVTSKAWISLIESIS